MRLPPVIRCVATSKEITCPVKKCHRKRGVPRHVLSAERRWSSSVSRQYCSVGTSRISRSFVRCAVLRKNSGLSAVNKAGTLHAAQRSHRAFHGVEIGQL